MRDFKEEYDRLIHCIAMELMEEDTGKFFSSGSKGIVEKVFGFAVDVMEEDDWSYRTRIVQILNLIQLLDIETYGVNGKIVRSGIFKDFYEMVSWDDFRYEKMMFMPITKRSHRKYRTVEPVI